MVYVGSAEDQRKDQILDSSPLGPIQKGTSTFEYDVQEFVFKI